MQTSNKSSAPLVELGGGRQPGGKFGNFPFCWISPEESQAFLEHKSNIPGLGFLVDFPTLCPISAAASYYRQGKQAERTQGGGRSYSAERDLQQVFWPQRNHPLAIIDLPPKKCLQTCNNPRVSAFWDLRDKVCIRELSDF